MSKETHRIEITPVAYGALEAILDRRTRSAIIGRIDSLESEPEKQGKPLRGWLAGFRSLRAAGQRYRILFRIDTIEAIVTIYFIGIRKEGSRKDVYALAEHLVRRGLL